MSYTKKTWKNYPDTTTPITADNLNHMEDGIADAHTEINALNTSLLQHSTFPSGVGFYPDEQDGVKGFNTDPQRGADTFTPFSSGKYLYHIGKFGDTYSNGIYKSSPNSDVTRWNINASTISSVMPTDNLSRTLQFDTPIITTKDTIVVVNSNLGIDGVTIPANKKVYITVEYASSTGKTYGFFMIYVSTTRDNYYSEGNVVYYQSGRITQTVNINSIFYLPLP